MRTVVDHRVGRCAQGGYARARSVGRVNPLLVSRGHGGYHHRSHWRMSPRGRRWIAGFALVPSSSSSTTPTSTVAGVLVCVDAKLAVEKGSRGSLTTTTPYSGLMDVYVVRLFSDGVFAMRFLSCG